MALDLEILLDENISYPVDEDLLVKIILVCKHNRGKPLKVLVAEPRKNATSTQHQSSEGKE